MPLPFAVVEPSLPDHCNPSGRFLTQLSQTFHTCIPTNLAFFSILLGILSIAAWLFAQLPQIYKNYVFHSTSGLSIFFLVEWLLGDLTNLLGCFFTEQATWQVVLAFYYCCVDVMLCGQWLWYDHFKHGRPWREARTKQDDTQHPPQPREDRQQRPTGPVRTPSQPIRRKQSSTGMFCMPGFSVSPSSWKRNGDDAGLSESPSGRPTITRDGRGAGSPIPGVSPFTVLYISMVVAIVAQGTTATPLRSVPRSSMTMTMTMTTTTVTETPSQIAGRLLSWISTLLYLGSRLPQLYKNHRRKSTSGLSPQLFIAAFFGNLFYSSSILTNPSAWSDLDPHGGGGWVGGEGSNQGIWVRNALPFWLGATGVLVMDAAVGVQFLMYSETASTASSPDVVVEVEAEDDEGRRTKTPWRRVDGWMRGWYPSVSIAGTPRPATPRGPFWRDDIAGADENESGRGISNLEAAVARWEERQRLLDAEEQSDGTSYGRI